MRSNKPLYSILMLSTLLGSAAMSGGAVVVIDNFDTAGDEGHFVSAPNFSGSNRRVAPHLTSPGAGIAPSTADQDFTEFFAGSASQKLVINRETDPSLPAPTVAPAGPGEWFLRHVSGATPGSPASNVAIPNTGSAWVGFWVKTTAANVEAGIMLDDDNVTTPTVANNHEMSVFQPLINDGLWHLYQWELSNADSWNLFAGTQSNPGAINSPNVTIDSLTFRGVTGVADSVTFWVDSVSYSTNGPIPVPEPSAAALAGLALLGLTRRKR